MATPVQEQLHALYALQKIDTQIQKARRAQAVLDRGADAAQQAQSARDTEKTKRDRFHHLQADLKDNELKLSSVETKRKSYQQKLYQGSISNARELSNIEKEIDALGRQRSDLDSRILDLMEQVEQAQADLNVAVEKAHSAETHRNDTVAAFQSRYEALDLEITEAVRRRVDAAAAVTDKALLKQYEDIRARMSGIGIARVDDGDCGGCHMKLPTAVIKLVEEGRQVQTCENCARLLTD